MTQPQTRRCEVLVVGAGPAGLATAHWLRAWGIDVVVVERRTAPREHPQATMVNTRTTEILRFLGLSDPVLAESTTLESSSRVTFLADLAGTEIGRIEIIPTTEKLMDFAAAEPHLAGDMSTTALAAGDGAVARPRPWICCPGVRPPRSR